jgi:hypothetical protein
LIAYKFLCDGSVGRFSEFRWPVPNGDSPGEWVEVDGELEECLTGIHACRVEDLPGWIDDELWEVELGGAVVELSSRVVAPRGRLTRRIDAWNGEAAAEFASACAERARELVAAGAAGEAPAFAADADALVAGRRPEMWDERFAAPPQSASATAANLGFVVAHAAGNAALERAGDADAYGEAFAAERAWQVDWLAERLGLTR